MVYKVHTVYGLSLIHLRFFMRGKSPFKSSYPSTIGNFETNRFDQTIFSYAVLNPLAKKGCSVQAMLLKSAVTNTFVISLKDNREHAE